jgi:hypothetical protein
MKLLAKFYLNSNINNSIDIIIIIIENYFLIFMNALNYLILIKA